MTERERELTDRCNKLLTLLVALKEGKVKIEDVEIKANVIDHSGNWA